MCNMAKLSYEWIENQSYMPQCVLTSYSVLSNLKVILHCRNVHITGFMSKV